MCSLSREKMRNKLYCLRFASGNNDSLGYTKHCINKFMEIDIVCIILKGSGYSSQVAFYYRVVARFSRPCLRYECEY